MTPEETMAKIVSLRRAGNMEEASIYFEDDAVLVIQPGSHAVGRKAIKDGLIAMSKVFPVFHITERTAVVSGSVALHHSRWHAQSVGPKGEPVEAGGLTSDVLRQQQDGSWKVAIDNPWGGNVLD